MPTFFFRFFKTNEYKLIIIILFCSLLVLYRTGHKLREKRALILILDHVIAHILIFFIASLSDYLFFSIFLWLEFQFHFVSNVNFQQQKSC